MRQVTLTVAVGVCSALLLGAGVTSAGVRFTFDPDDLVGLYPASAGDEDVTGENKVTQPNARRLHGTWASTWYETFYNPAAAHTQPDDYNTYVNWRAGLGDGEGISAFNIWLLDNPNARSWGEKVVWNPGGAVPTAWADPEGKWAVEVIANPWGAGWLVQWSTDNSADYLRPGSNIGNFGFAGDAYWDLDEDGYDDTDDVALVDGESARIWFGAVNWTESDGEGGWTQEWSVHFDNAGWGTDTPAYAAFPAGRVGEEGYGSGWEGVLEVPTLIPEPGMLGCVGLALVGFGRRRRR